MPFRSALSAGNQTTKRGGVYSALRFVAALTPTVQLQFNPSVAANGNPAGQITRSTNLSGSHNNLLYGMTVYITPSSDWKADLKNRPEDCLKTYVREVAPTSTLLYIGWTAFQWTTSHYVTVVDNFECHPKKTRIVGTTIYKNVDIAFRAPLPRITGLYATLAMTSTGSANISPTPTETAMSSGASISSRTWAKIVNGTVTKAVSSSATPTISMPTGIHWLHVTTTDSGLRTNWFAMLVVVCPYDMSSVVSKLVAGGVTNDLNAGISAELTTTTDISTLVPGTAALVFDDLTYRDGTVEQVVKAFGWMDGDVSQEISGDETYGIRTTYSTRLTGVRDAASTIRLPAFPFKYNANPTTWGQVSRCTVYDAIWYAASEHSTVANLAAFDFPSNYTDYQYNPAIQIPEGTLFDSLDTLAFFASGGMANYSPNGEVYFRQSLLYDTSASSRNAATVYGTYTTGDAMVTRLNRPPVNKFPLSAIQGGFATWNTTTNTPRVYQSIAPQDNTPAALLESVDGIILTKNLSDANAKIEAGKLAVNHFFASTQPSIVSGDFLAGYTTLEASCFQWHQFAIDSTETLDGISYDTNTRFLCTQVTSNYNADEWGLTVSAEFREETDGGDNYARETEFVPLGTTQPYPTYPVGDFSPYLEDFGLPSDYYGDEHDDQRQGWEDPTLPPEEAAESANPGAGVAETLYVPLTGGAVGTSFTSTLGRSYLLRISGKGRIAEASPSGEWCYRVDFRDSDGGWIASTASSHTITIAGTYSAGSGWTSTDITEAGFNIRGLSIELTLPGGTSRAYTRFIVEYSYTYGHLDVDFLPPDYPDGNIWRFENGGSNMPFLTIATVSDGAFQGTNKTWDLSGSYTGTSNTFKFSAETSEDNVVPKTYDGAITIHAIEVHGIGTLPFPSDNCGTEVIGDAFWYAGEDVPADVYANGGLFYQGAEITHALEYNPAGTYEVTVVGDGSQMIFSFVDDYDSDLTNNQDVNIKVEIIPL